LIRPKPINSFAHGQSAVRVLPSDVGFAAHLFCQFDSAVDLVNFRLPAQNLLSVF
jgi:hypothetical protein